MGQALAYNKLTAARSGMLISYNKLRQKKKKKKFMNVPILLKVGFNISKLTDQIPHLQ